MTKPTIFLSIGRTPARQRVMRVMYRPACGSADQPLGEFPLTVTGVTEARAFAKEMRIVYNVLADHDAAKTA